MQSTNRRKRWIPLTVALATLALALATPAQAAGTSNGLVGNAAGVVAPQAPSAPMAAQDVKILEANCPRGPQVYDIGRGSTGTAVREVQCLLNWTLSAGAYPYIQVDGVFGSITEGGVIVFQRCANALGAGLVVDGRVGPKTLPHLRWWGEHAYRTGDFIC